MSLKIYIFSVTSCLHFRILNYFSFQDSKNFGWDINGEITFDWKRLIENKEYDTIYR